MKKPAICISLLFVFIISLPSSGISKARLDTLVSDIQSDDQSQCSKAAIKLGEYGPEAREAIPAILEILRGETFNIYASIVLPYIAKEEPTDTILMLTRDKSRYVQTSATAILRRHKLEKEQSLAIYTQLLNHENPFVRLDAIQALNTLGAGDVCVDAAIELVRNEDPVVSGSALRQLGEIGIVNERVKRVLLNSFQHPEKREAVKAALIYQKFYPKEKQGIIRIQELMKDDDRNVRWLAVRAVGDLQEVDVETLRYAKTLIDDEDKLVSLRACYAMIKHDIDQERAWKLINESLESDDFLEIITPLTVLRDLGPLAEKYEDKVIQFINNPNKVIQVVSVGVLGEIYTSRDKVLPVLKHKLKTTDDFLVWNLTNKTIEKINSQEK